MRREEGETWDPQEVVDTGYDNMDSPGWTQDELEVLAEADNSPSHYGEEYVPSPAQQEVPYYFNHILHTCTCEKHI